MNRMAVGALCVVACVFSVGRTQRRRAALGASVLEKLEAIFDVLEIHLYPAKYERS